MGILCCKLKSSANCANQSSSTDSLIEANAIQGKTENKKMETKTSVKKGKSK